MRQSYISSSCAFETRWAFSCEIKVIGTKLALKVIRVFTLTYATNKTKTASHAQVYVVIQDCVTQMYQNWAFSCQVNKIKTDLALKFCK